MDGINIGPIVAVPKSRGWVRIRSRDPYEAPNINPNFLSDKEDLDIMVEGKKYS